MQRSLVCSILATVALAACSESTGPSRHSLIGDYVATTFTTTRDTVTWDQLDDGGYVYVRLREDRAIQAVTVVPSDAVNEDGEDMKLVGTWRLNGSSVRLVSDDETFLEAFVFHPVDSTLVGEATFGAVTARLVLSPQPLK